MIEPSSVKTSMESLPERPNRFKDASGRVSLSVIIPTRNEPLIEQLVKEVHDALGQTDHEIIVVDRSDVPPKLDRAKVIIQKGKGLGRAIVQGLAIANGEWVAIMDGDFSHRPEDLARLVGASDGYDFVLGSRYAPGGQNHDSLPRRVVSRAFNRFARLVLGLKFRDPMSGLIIARTEVFEIVQPNPIGFKINLEVIYKAARIGFRGVEVPIKFIPRAAGRSKAGVSEAVRTMTYIISLRLRKSRSG